GGSDQPMSVIFDATDKKDAPVPVAAYPVNDTPASTDTNAYDTNVAMLPFQLSDVGVPDGATSYPIRYQAVTFSGFYGDPTSGLSVDSTGWVSADLVRPALQTDGLLVPDQKGEKLPYSTPVPVAATTTKSGTGSSGTDRAASVGSTVPAPTPVKALVLHLHGKSGQRAQVLTAP
ncbi:MAG TPA: hypothetical protein VFP34_00180, partial [Microlunatus sp.]|nr:hypothetical protein [Microlunatus sp.]